MVSISSTSVNAHRTGGIDRHGIDLDISFDKASRLTINAPIRGAAVIDIWSESATRPGRAELASGGATCTPIHNQVKRDAADPNSLLSTSKKSPRSTETKRRWSLKAAAVRMLRHDLKETERGPSVCGCGLAAYDPDEHGQRTEVTIHRNGKSRAWVSGVYRCKHAWLCPTCAPAVAKRRQENVFRVVEATVERGGHFVMGLVTLSHSKGDRLADLKKMLTESFAAARRGAPWERIKARADIAGVLVAVEVTHGDHGWHIHIHYGMPCLSTDKTHAENAGRTLVDRFMRQVNARGGKTSLKAQGWEVAVSPEAAAEYISKGASWELAGNAHKSEADGDTIWDIVADADVGDVGAFGLFKEYARAMPGTRSCIVTKRMRDRLGLDDADVPEEPSEQQFDDEGAIVGHVLSHTWHRFLRMKLAGTFLDRVESIDGDVLAETFERIVSETETEADTREGVITRKRADKIQKTAQDIDVGLAVTQAMLARTIANQVRRAQALGRVAEFITQRIAAFRADGHPDAALPTPSGVVAEIARIDREELERRSAQKRLQKSPLARIMKAA